MDVIAVQTLTFFVFNFVDPYEYHMDLCSESCMSGWPDGWLAFCMARILALDITHKLVDQICSYQPCSPLTSTISNHFH